MNAELFDPEPVSPGKKESMKIRMLVRRKKEKLRVTR